MKLALALALCLSASAQTVSIPISAMAHLYHHTPGDVTFRRTANAALQMFSAGDYVTTIRYGSPGGPRMTGGKYDALPSPPRKWAEGSGGIERCRLFCVQSSRIP